MIQHVCDYCGNGVQEGTAFNQVMNVKRRPNDQMPTATGGSPKDMCNECEVFLKRRGTDIKEQRRFGNQPTAPIVKEQKTGKRNKVQG